MRLRLTDQPVAYSAAFKAVLAALVILRVVHVDGEQVAALSVAFDAMLGVLVFASVTPNAKVDAKVDQAASNAKNETLAYVSSLRPTPARRAPAKKAAAKTARR